MARATQADGLLLEQAVLACWRSGDLRQAALLQTPLAAITPTVAAIEAEFGLFRQALAANDKVAAKAWKTVMVKQVPEHPVTLKAGRMAKAAGIR
jgi:hypothetical protein